MTTNQSLLERRKAVLPTGLGVAFPIFAEKAKNSEIWDIEGKRYIDFVGGISVLNTGHSHPKITQRVHEQLDKFTHTAAQMINYECYVDLAEKLCEKAPISGDKKAFFLTTRGLTNRINYCCVSTILIFQKTQFVQVKK